MTKPLFAVCLLVCGPLWAGGQDQALPDEVIQAVPFIQSFAPEEHGGHPQSWGFGQLNDHRIVVANNNGVLVHDGDRWELVAPGDGFFAEGFERDDQGRILAITRHDFGVLQAEPGQPVEFSSLTGEEAFIEPGEQRLQHHAMHQGQLWLATRSALWCYCEGSLEKVATDNDGGLGGLFKFRDALYIQRRNRGFERVGRDGLDALQPQPDLHDEAIEAVFTDAHGRYLAVTRESRLLQIDASEADLPLSRLDEEDGWQEAASRLEGQRISEVLELDDGRVAVGTVARGVKVFNGNGALEMHLDQTSGLPVNSVMGLFQDREGGLWVATIHGIARAELHQPLRSLDGRETPGSVIHHLIRHEGALWLAASSGVWRYSEGRFESAGLSSDQSWSLHALDGGHDPPGLLAATSAGLRYWDGTESSEITSGRVAFVIERLADGVWLMGTEDGIYRVRYADNVWQAEAVPETGGEIRSLEVDAEGVAWAGSLDGLAYRLTADAGPAGDYPVEGFEVTRLDADTGLPESNYVEVYMLGGEIRLGTRAGIFRPSDNGTAVEPDPDFPESHTDGSRGWFLATEDVDGGVHAQILQADSRASEFFRRESDGQYVPADGPFSRLTDSTGQAYLSEDSGIWLAAGTDLYFSAHAARPDGDDAPSPLIGRITGPAGNAVNPEGRTLPASENSLSFHYSTPAFDFPERRHWRTRLEGFDQDFSDWSEATFRDYTNLPGGDYRFQVQFRDGWGRTSPVASLPFSVAPAWYLQPAAMAAWIGLALLLLLFTGWLARRTVAAHNRHLQTLVQDRTREIEDQRDQLARMAFTDSLTGLGNRRALYRELETAAGRARDNGRSISLLAMDLDRFKLVNDRHGHAAGDSLLRALAEVLGSHCRSDDRLFRLGGDEFVMLLDDCDEPGATALAQRLRSSVHELDFSHGQQPVRVGISVGVAAEAAPESWEVLLERADQALYRSKQQNQVVVDAI